MPAATSPTAQTRKAPDRDYRAPMQDRRQAQRLIGTPVLCAVLSLLSFAALVTALVGVTVGLVTLITALVGWGAGRWVANAHETG